MYADEVPMQRPTTDRAGKEADTPVPRSAPQGCGHVVVVGAGLAGLSAAMHLRGSGRAVTVLECGAAPGGRAARTVRTSPGGRQYHLDTGPTVLTMPDLVADCFAAIGESMSDWVQLQPLDPAYDAHFSDGSHLRVTTDVEEMARRIEAFAGAADAAGYRAYVDFVSELYRLQLRQFIDHNFTSPLDLVNTASARLVAMRGFSRLAPTVARYFTDDRLQRLFSFQSMYAGVSPQRALALYAVISYMDLVEGVYYPTGGMNALPTAMAAAAGRAGVDLVYGATVTSVEPRDGGGRRVVTAEAGDWPADAVVLTPDVPVALSLLDQRQGRRRVRYSPSCVVLAAGVRRSWPGTAHHNMHFGRAWSQVFADLDEGRLMADPSFLVSLPSVSDASLAPAGASSAYVLFPAPNLGADLDWARLRGPYRDHMLRAVESAGYPGFADAIEVEELITPLDWAERGMAMGTPFAAAHTFGQTGPFRTPNRVADDVVLAGSGTTPGVGVPMVLISGRLAAEHLTGPVPTYRSLAWR